MRRFRYYTRSSQLLLATLLLGLGQAAEAQRITRTSAAAAPQPVASPALASQAPTELSALLRSGWVQIVHFEAPAGAVVEIASNSGSIHLELPGKVGLELGRPYRLRISDIPGKPGVTFYPTLRLIGYLLPPSHVDPMEYPIRVQFLDRDFSEASAGRLVSNVVFLEDPLTALPVSYPPGEMPVLETQPGEQALLRASSLGRPMLFIQMGNRIPLDDQLASSSDDPPVHMVPEAGYRTGNGDGIVQPVGWQWAHGSAPFGNCAGCRASTPACTWDPPIVRLPYKVHPRMPQDECVPDGGDAVPYAHFDGYGQVAGLGASETVARFSRPGEGPRMAVSNQVCLYAPRFGLVRSSSVSIAGVHLEGPRGMDHQARRMALESREAATFRSQRDEARLVRRRERLSTLAMNEPPSSLDEVRVIAAAHRLDGFDRMFGQTGPNTMGQSDDPRIALSIEAAKAWTREQNPAYTALTESGGQIFGTMRAGEIQQIKDANRSPGELVLWKTVTPRHARQGDVVEFAIYYKNVGQRPLENISVIDSLTARLEYVPNSAKTDRRAVFTASPNDVDSQELRWDILDPVEGGKGGVVWFQAKVR